MGMVMYTLNPYTQKQWQADVCEAYLVYILSSWPGQLGLQGDSCLEKKRGGGQG